MEKALSESHKPEARATTTPRASDSWPTNVWVRHYLMTRPRPTSVRMIASAASRKGHDVQDVVTALFRLREEGRIIWDGDPNSLGDDDRIVYLRPRKQPEQLDPRDGSPLNGEASKQE